MFNAQIQSKPVFYVFYVLYKEYAGNASSGMESTAVDTEAMNPYVDVYNLLGRIVAKQMPREQVYDLPAGAYIVDGKKMIIAH